LPDVLRLLHRHLAPSADGVALQRSPDEAGAAVPSEAKNERGCGAQLWLAFKLIGHRLAPDSLTDHRLEPDWESRPVAMRFPRPPARVGLAVIAMRV